MVAWYRAWSAILTALWTLAALVAAMTARPTLAYLTLSGLVLTFVAVYLAARRQTRRALPEALAPRPVLEAGLEPAGSLGRPPMPGGRLGQAGPYLLLLATGAWLRFAWSGIADRFPIHYDLSMQPDAWADKTPAVVLAPLLFGLLMVGGLRLGALMLRTRSRRPVTPGDVERLRLGLAAFLGAEYLLAVTFSLVALIPLLQASLGAEGTLAVLLVAPHLGTLGLLVWLLHRTSRLPRRAEDATDRMDDRYWKAGLIYSNPNDPAVWVEKRFGIGYTLNFARADAWWFLAAVVLVPLAASLLLGALL